MLTANNQLMKTIQLLLLTLALAGGASHGVAQPVITVQPRNQTNVVGTTATFTVEATGTPPLTYQWRSYPNSTLFTNIPFPYIQKNPRKSRFPLS